MKLKYNSVYYKKKSISISSYCAARRRLSGDCGRRKYWHRNAFQLKKWKTTTWPHSTFTFHTQLQLAIVWQIIIIIHITTIIITTIITIRRIVTILIIIAVIKARLIFLIAMKNTWKCMKIERKLAENVPGN